MASSKAYIPSALLIRSLARPLPRRCRLAQRLPSQQPLRTKTSKAAKARKAAESQAQRPPPLSEPVELSHHPTALNDSGISALSWYEQDASGNERLISRIANKEDLARFQKQHRMLEEDAAAQEAGKPYDDSELKRSLLDDMMTDPNFAPFTDELERMKKNIMSREEEAALQRKIEKETEGEVQDIAASEMMSTHEMLQELIDDPELIEVQDEILAVQGRLPEYAESGFDNPDFVAMMEALDKKLESNPAFQRRLASIREEQGEANALEIPDSILPTEDDSQKPGSAEADLDKLLEQMQGVMKAMGGDPQLEADLEAVRNEEIEAENKAEAEMDAEKLAEHLKSLVKADQGSATKSEPEELAEVEEDPEMQAKIDKILQDPKLMEKLAMIKDVIAQRNSSAPDPYALPSSETTTLASQLALAARDPEHQAALSRLRIYLLPPFNVSPALHMLNEALRYAYLGANDDVRRILWRAYMKARAIPGLLENIPDDAWDILWYSQAVDWGSNQNRESHLTVLRKDLSRVGRDGPPTKAENLGTL